MLLLKRLHSSIQFFLSLLLITERYIFISTYTGLIYVEALSIWKKKKKKKKKHFGYAQKKSQLKGSVSSKQSRISEILFNVWIGCAAQPWHWLYHANNWPAFLWPFSQCSHHTSVRTFYASNHSMNILFKFGWGDIGLGKRSSGVHWVDVCQTNSMIQDWGLYSATY